VRAAGTFGILIRKDSQFAWIKLPSSKKFYKKDILLKCSLFGFGTLGRVSNMMHKNTNLGKAGRAWWLGRKSIVRGVAMNPIDHPHGGGEGKKSKKASPVNKWGTLIKFSRVFKRKKS
jgi:large subunit ribosomal protein L2